MLCRSIKVTTRGRDAERLCTSSRLKHVQSGVPCHVRESSTFCQSCRERESEAFKLSTHMCMATPMIVPQAVTLRGLAGFLYYQHHNREYYLDACNHSTCSYTTDAVVQVGEPGEGQGKEEGGRGQRIVSSNPCLSSLTAGWLLPCVLLCL